MTYTPTEVQKKNSTTIAKIMLIEDDDATRQLLTEHLSADRYEVFGAATATEGLRLIKAERPDMVLLDLSLPDRSGLDVLNQIRAEERGPGGTGVIVLSGRGTERDRVRGLEKGADDYVVKPYGYGELLARIGAVLRRRIARAEQVIKAGEIEIDLDSRSVTVEGRQVELSSKEFALLKCLASEPTKVHTKEALLRDTWGYRSIGHTRILDAHASRLRRKLDPESGRFIVDCWGVGYRCLNP